MGRLIDVADLNIALGMEVLYGNKTAIQVIQEAPTVEAIPKSEYETRLKADMVAMLTELQLEIDELPNHGLQSSDWKQGFTHGLADVQEKVIQKKINELKADQEGEE